MSKIIPAKVKMAGDSEPRVRYALVFDDATHPDDLIAYRNAATSVVKALINDTDYGPFLADDLYFLLQFSEFITVAIEEVHKKPVSWEQYAKTQLREFIVQMQDDDKEGDQQ